MSLKFAYKNIFILVSIATVLYEIWNTYHLNAIIYEYYKHNTHIQPTAFSHLHVIYRFLQSAVLNNLIYNVQLQWA